MISKTLFCLATTITLSLSFQGIAHSNPTKWEIVDASLSDLINSGWQLLGITSNRVAYRNTISPGGFDEETFIFSLAKNGQHIICSVDNPNPPIARNARCRKIS
jgi:hypothetical protein